MMLLTTGNVQSNKYLTADPNLAFKRPTLLEFVFQQLKLSSELKSSYFFFY